MIVSAIKLSVKVEAAVASIVLKIYFRILVIFSVIFSAAVAVKGDVGVMNLGVVQIDATALKSASRMCRRGLKRKLSLRQKKIAILARVQGLKRALNPALVVLVAAVGKL